MSVHPNARPALQRSWFPIILGLGLIAYEILFAWLLIQGQPPGTSWLGDTLQNSGDAAVYLNQIRQGSVLFRNLYAVEPHALRFDLIWSSLSVVHALTKLSPVQIHEIARWAATLLLAFSIHAAARTVAKDEREARTASSLAVGGIGLGWLHSVTLGAAARWSPMTDGAPDLVSEFAVIPTLLGGVHMIVSLALLIFIMRGIWEVVADPGRRVWTVALAIAALTSFHPYFVPLVAAGLAIAWTKRLRDTQHHEGMLRGPLLLGAALVPAVSYYAWLAFTDPIFRTHHLETNILPIASWDRWAYVLAPAALAFAWIAMRHANQRLFLKQGRWCIAWLMIASVLTLLLPVPWTRKLTEGLMVPLVLLTLPFWTAIRGMLPRFARGMLLAGLVGAVPLHLFASQAVWLRSPEHAQWFNRPQSVFNAWSALADEPTALVLTDNLWTNIWTPAWTGKPVWIGHNHETPDYARKLAVWRELFSAREPETVRFTLQHVPVTHLLLTAPDVRERFMPLLPPGEWAVVSEEEGAILLKRRAQEK